ncbi:hypothetical protein BH10BAC2_BH10BAC2_33030 [soil metagenome]
MKKFLLLTFLIVSTSQSFAFVTQGNWRWRKDDGSETTATWMAAENTAASVSSGSDNIRLRIELFNSGSSNTDVNTSILVYSPDGGTTWDSVSNIAGSRPFVLAGSSPFVNNLDATTRQLTSRVGYVYTAGQIITSSSTLGNNNIIPEHATEYEWVIKPTANMLPSTTYLFKADTKPGDGTYDGDAPTPSLTTEAILPVRLVDFTVKPDGKKVKIEWSTAFEQNNDRFEIERSTDSRTWKTIATVKGNGTTSQKSSYQAFDNLPLKGTNYYRVKQYDLNGKAYASDIRSLKMLIENSLISVYPNPARSVINFTLRDYSGKNVVATLTNNNGRIIHSETIKDIQTNVTYKLNTKQQPAPGIYVLHLKADGLSETIKIVVQ